MIQKNWAGNHVYQAADVAQPETIAELQTLIKHSHKAKVLGSRHSFNHIADTTATHVTLGKLPRVLEIDAVAQQVTVSGDMAYGAFCAALHQAGFGLHNLASLPHISVAGACATATHGSGVSNGNLATAVAALELVTGRGELVTLTRDDADFAGAVVNLGALGVVTKLTLDVQPTYQVRQTVFENLPFEDGTARLLDVLGMAYSVSLFTEWRDGVFSQVWVKARADGDSVESVLGATPAGGERHPLVGISAEPCTPQLGVPGPWHERLPHFRMAFTPSHGDELQSEYFMTAQHAGDALRALATIADQIAPLVMVTEVRAIAADSLWMSPCYEQASVAIHFTWQPDWPNVRQLLPKIEALLAPFGAKPHWGKLFTMQADAVRAGYVKLPDFQQLVHKYDPQGKFHNQFLASYVL